MNEAEKARMVAEWFHRGQTDMAGEPYLGHLERTAQRVARFGPQAVAVAFLHDIIEDTACTMFDLNELGFSTEVRHAVFAITQQVAEEPETGTMVYEPLEHYWQRVKANHLAHIVKVYGDIPDNDDEDRMQRGNMRMERRTKLHDKYARALVFLGKPDV